MADHHESKASEAVWDGRFGEKFDDEVSTSGVAWTIIGTGLITIIAMILMYGFFHWVVADSGADSADPLTLAVGDVPAPPLPRLQAKPEAEYRAFDVQVTEHLESYGWVDESAGIAHIPIAEAIDLLLDRGLGTTAPTPAEEDEATEEATGS